MKIALLQTELLWENPVGNRECIEDKVSLCDENYDLLVLPEMFSTGFTMNPDQVAETMQGDTVRWMQKLAMSRKCAVTGSLVIQEGGHYYNRMVFVFPDGALQYYDKRHLFTLAKEHEVYTPGKEKVIVRYKDWKICLQVCYDLRFPVFARNTEDYDLLLYVASWPQPRIQAWDILLRARAVENLSYVVGLNRVGTDGSFLEYTGHSQVVDCLGNYVIEPFEGESLKIALLNKKEMEQTRNRLNFLNDRDAFTLTI